MALVEFKLSFLLNSFVDHFTIGCHFSQKGEVETANSNYPVLLLDDSLCRRIAKMKAGKS